MVIGRKMVTGSNHLCKMVIGKEVGANTSWGEETELYCHDDWA